VRSESTGKPLPGLFFLADKHTAHTKSRGHFDQITSYHPYPKGNYANNRAKEWACQFQEAVKGSLHNHEW